MRLIATHKRTLRAITYRDGVFVMEGQRLDAHRVMEMDAAGLLRWCRPAERELVTTLVEKQDEA